METEGYLLESHSESGSFPSPRDAQGCECSVGPCSALRIFERRGKERCWHLQGSPSEKFPGSQSSFRTPLGTSVTPPPFLLHGLLWCHGNYHTSLMPEDVFSSAFENRVKYNHSSPPGRETEAQRI